MFGIVRFLFLEFLELFNFLLFCSEAYVLTMSSQDKILKGQRKSAFCGHFMADWDDHHNCPKCRDDLKGHNSCVTSSSTDCSVCSAFYLYLNSSDDTMK